MNNTRNIEPVAFWSPEGPREASRIGLYNFHGYDFDGTDSRVSYRLLAPPGEALFEGTVTVPAAVTDGWGADDEVIFDHVITALGLTKAEE